MPPLAPDTWAELRRRARSGESHAALAKAYGVARSTIARRLAAKGGPAARSLRPKSKATPRSHTRNAPAPKISKAVPPAMAARRKLLNRLYKAIDTKLKLMERRMHSEITALAADATSDAAAPRLSAADHERETRAFGALVKTINSVKDMQAELDRIATGTDDTAADARLAADAERYRRDIAQRLARFVAPGT